MLSYRRTHKLTGSLPEETPRENFRIWCFSGPYFPAYQLNIETYIVSLRIRSKFGKIRIRKTLNTDIFHAMFPLLFSQY